MLRKGKINLRKAKILGMYAIDISTARPKWRQTPVTAYICLYHELNLKIVEYIQYTPRGFPTFRKTPRTIFRAENLSVFPKSVFLGVFSIFPPRTFYRPSYKTVIKYSEFRGGFPPRSSEETKWRL